MPHFGWLALCTAREERRMARGNVRGAAEVLKPQVLSSPFGHFWDCGQK